MRLYMVRHGESENNLARKYTGWAQVQLTEKGRRDAEGAGKFLRGKHFDRIYSSDLIRAIDTAQIALPGCQPIQLPELREINVGTLSERPIDECIAYYGQSLRDNLKEGNYVPYGGENRAMLQERVNAFLHMLEENPCEQVVAFAHAGTLRAVLAHALGEEARNKAICPNCCIASFVYDNGRWLMEGWGLGEK